MRVQKSQCDIIGLQEVRRGGQGSFVAAGYTVYFSGSDKGGNHGVGLAVAKRIVDTCGTLTPEPINERLLKVQLSLSGKSNRVTFVVAYAPTECAADSEKTKFWSMLLETVASVPRKDQLFVLMDANARTGKRDRGGSLEYAQVIGPYGRDVLNDNGEHLVRTAADAGMAITNTFFSNPKGGQQSTYVSPKGDAWRLDYILTRQSDRRLVRKITVVPVSRAESDHSIVAATIRLLGRFAPNRPKSPANRQPRIDRQKLVNDIDIRRDLARAIDNELRESPMPPTGEVDYMVNDFTEKVLKTAIRLLPPPSRRTPTYGWCADENVRQEMDEAWDRREKAWKAWREVKGTDAERGRRKEFAREGRVLKRLQQEGVQRFFDAHARGLEKRVREGDSMGF